MKREAAAEAAREAARAEKRSRRFGALSGVSFPMLSPKAILNHPNFTVILSVWSAGLLGLCVLALSSVDIARISMVAGLGALGHFAKVVYAAIAAAIGGVGGFVAALAMARAFGRPVAPPRTAATMSKDVQPIDLDELGSESLDAPLDKVPFADGDDAALNGGALDLGPLDLEGLEAPDPLDTPQQDAPDDVFELNALTELDAPQDDETAEPDAREEEPSENILTLAKPTKPGLKIDIFREILDEETRRHEEREAATAKGKAAKDTAIQPPAPTALAKLRETAPQDLSLVQLVERFAAALHQVQDRSPNELATDRIARESAERERALAQALKALELFTDHGFDRPGPSTHAGEETGGALSKTERDLRDALTKLQTLRGAA